MPDGNRSQIQVPLDSTVDQLSSMLRTTTSDDIHLSFGNADLPPTATLLDTNIVDAYEHAGNLLQVIGNAGGDADAKTAALDAACAVVERVSNGVKDMETLCAAAMEPPPLSEPIVPPSPHTAGIVAAGAEEAERDTPKELDDGEFKMLSSMLTHSVDGGRFAKDVVDAPEKATPSALVHGLSRRLPQLFPHSAAVAAVGEEQEEEGVEDQQEEGGGGDEQPSLSRRQPSLGVQPSISSIRAARRIAKANLSLKSMDMEDAHAATALTIGHSTNGVLLAPDFSEASPPLEESMKGEGSVWMASNAKSTWLEDVMKTWEVGVVRQSGVLEKTKDGQELNDYLNSLEEEALKEAEIDAIEAQTLKDKHSDKPQGATQLGPHVGESEDEVEANADEKGKTQSSCVPRATDLEHSTEVQKSDVVDSKPSRAVNSTGAIQQTKVPMRHALHAKNGPTNPSTDSSETMRTAPSMQDARSIPSPSISSASTEHIGTLNLNPGCNFNKPPRIVRQATKIAPAPDLSLTSLPNGAHPNVMFLGNTVQSSMTWPPPVVPSEPKKRGRKRKNPELTEEERAIVRKEQNRESAKLSRVRRKVIAAEYEGRLKSLVGENMALRKQVDGLNNRLVYLQSLLTVSVRSGPAPTSSQR